MLTESGDSFVNILCISFFFFHTNERLRSAGDKVFCMFSTEEITSCYNS